MYAIVDIAGQQFKVEKDQQIFVHRLEGNEGDKVSFNQVLLIENDGKIAVGAPAVNDAAVTGKIIEHLRGDKVIVFKKKRRKGYQKRNGHRQDFTKIQIESILETGGSKIAAKAPAAKVKEVEVEAKAEVKKPAAKAASSTAKTETKTTSAKTEKKPAAKKTAAAKPKAEGVKKAPAKKATPKKKADDK